MSEKKGDDHGEPETDPGRQATQDDGAAADEAVEAPEALPEFRSARAERGDEAEAGEDSGGAGEEGEGDEAEPEDEWLDDETLVEPAPPKLRQKGRRRKAGLLGLWSFFLAFVVLAFVGFVVAGRPIAAPDWLKARIEAQINSQLGGAARIGFGEVALVLEDVLHPRVHLRDVALTDAEDRPILTLADVNGTFAPGPLLKGEVQPSRIWLSGAQFLIRRDAGGKVAVSFGGAAGNTAREAANFAQLVEDVDRALQTPALAKLRAVTAEGLTIRYEDLRAGRAWTVDGGRIGLVHDGTDLTLRGDFALLSGGASAALIEMNYASRVGSPASSFGMNFEGLPASDIAAQSAALLWLDVLRAPISGALRATTGEDGALGPLSATLQIGEGVLQPTEETKPVPFRSARAYFTYAPDSQTMRVDEMSVDTAWGSARAEGRVIMGAFENGLPGEFISQMRITEFRANPDGLYDAPITFSNAAMDGRLELAPFRFTLGELVLVDGESKLRMKGELRAEPQGWDVNLDGMLDTLAPERLKELWPKGVVGPTRDWVEANILGGQMKNVQIGLSARPKAKPAIYLGWEFDALKTRFMKTMPPIEAGRGHATLYRNRLTVVADAGRVQAGQGGAVDITGTVFTIPDVTIKEAPAEVHLKTASTITAALSLLDREPFRYISKAGQVVTLADGRAEAEGTIRLRLKKKVPPEEVDFEVAAKLSDVRSEVLVPGRVLAAAALEARADNKLLVVEGTGRLGQVPIEGSFTAPLGPGNGGRSSVAGSIELSQRFVDEFRLGLPRGSVSGSGRGAVKIDLRRGEKADFTLTSDLAGVALRVPQIGWAMGEGARGTLEVAGRLGDPVEVNRLALTAPGLTTSGRVVLGPGGSFERAEFDRVQAGSWLDVPVTLRGRGAGASPEVIVSSGTVDLSQTEIGAGSGSGASQGGGPMQVSLDRLKISEGISLTAFRGSFTTARGMTGEFAGRVNGQTAVTGRVVPQAGRSAFQIRSKDAGGVFKSAGLLPNARGGEMELTLAPGKGTGVYEGQLDASGVWLRKAPAMAALLNAISVIGLLEQLSGNGILFSEIEARFRLTPTQAIIAKSSAVGASMGISMDGFYNLESGAMNMQGVVSPFYLINGVGSVLTRKGEGLIGFNYTLRGTAERPRVQVNPLSLLTPGMFREIFRRPPPKLKE